jgi:hypothetical protein
LIDPPVRGAGACVQAEPERDARVARPSRHVVVWSGRKTGVRNAVLLSVVIVVCVCGSFVGLLAVSVSQSLVYIMIMPARPRPLRIVVL